MEHLLPWLILKAVPGVGNLLFKRLIDRFETPARVLAAGDDELARVEGIRRPVIAGIRAARPSDPIKRELALAYEKGFHIVTLADEDYPPLLSRIPDPPPFLYVYGSLSAAAHPVAMVGARSATGYGLSITRRLCRELVQSCRATIVSGLAKGIDTAAHEGALAGGGRTVAVLGSGLARIYPAGNRRLFHRIAAHGAVISEFPVMTGPDARHFPIRNRIISGMSLGTVVVEAAQRSGSLITARLAAEQNREVFAVPGSIESGQSSGTHILIRQGAKLVENAGDIIEELPELALGQASGRSAPLSDLPPLSPDESKVYGHLGPSPVHIDELGRLLAMDAGRLAAILVQLELKGLIRRSPGHFFAAEGTGPV